MMNWLLRKRNAITGTPYHYHEADLHDSGSRRFAFEPLTTNPVFESTPGILTAMNPPNPMSISYDRINLNVLVERGPVPGILPTSELFLQRLFKVDGTEPPVF